MNRGNAAKCKSTGLRMSHEEEKKDKLAR